MKNSKFGKVHLQWFGDADETTPIPQMEEPMYEVVDSLDDEDEEDVIKLSREEYEQLSQKPEKESGTADSVDQVMSKLAKAINDGRAPEGTGQVQPQQQGESWEDYLKRVDDELFGDKPSKAIVGIVERMTGGTVAQMGQIMMGQAKKLMELDPEKGKYYKKYKGEIEEKLKSYPAQWQNNPQALEQAYKDVLVEHQEELRSEGLEEMVEQRVKEALKARGIDPDKEESSGKGKTFDEGRGQNRTSQARNVKKIVLSEAEKNTARLMGFAPNAEGYAKYAKYKYGGKK